jgi:dihydroorotase
MFIGPHVHFRDGDPDHPDKDQSYKETIEHGLMVAERAGFTAVADMPNFNPPGTTRERIKNRIDKANSFKSKVKYFVYGGLTEDSGQVREIVQVWKEFYQVLALKIFCAHSTGRLGVIHERGQYVCMESLAREGFDGILASHHETESLNVDYFDPENPISHCFARPFYSEVESLKQGLRIADDVGYKGSLHVPHISVPEAAQIVYEEKQNGRKITSGVCPHHLIFDMEDTMREHGILLKMNPPLRPRWMKTELLEMLKDGRIDWLETDHAPHTLAEKTQKHSKASGLDSFPSGVPGIHVYPLMIGWLRDRGFSEERLRDISFNNANETFCLGLEPRVCEPELDLYSEYKSDVYKKFKVFEK